MSQDQFTQQDPTEQYAAPGSGDRTVEYPGRTGDMDVQPDMSPIFGPTSAVLILAGRADSM